ncbi:MAG: response regulator [Rhizobiales bacterium]|jgi:CheY-like chemotaxis protein|nr:response regulator [Hyphomicrobiales bacterium]OJU34298.1 MAG: response regulator [Rhizobiales bacterium 68-8]
MNEPLKILIVEDEALLAMELESLIEENGHEVAGWATSLAEAQQVLGQVKPDIALVDIHLADGPTGVEVAEFIRGNDLAEVVFLTANPKRIPEKFDGALGVISKPYTINGITAALRYLWEGVRRPPPDTARPVGFDLVSPSQAYWI